MNLETALFIKDVCALEDSAAQPEACNLAEQAVSRL